MVLPSHLNSQDSRTSGSYDDLFKSCTYCCYTFQRKNPVKNAPPAYHGAIHASGIPQQLSDMMGRFLRPGFVWVRHVNNSRNFDPRRRLGDKCRARLAEPSTEPFRKQQPFAQETTGDCETNAKNCLGSTLKNLLGGESHLLQRTQEDKRIILPQDLSYG